MFMENTVESLAIDIEILMNQNVPQTCHWSNLVRKLCGDDTFCAKAFQEISIFTYPPNLSFRKNVIADVDDGLDSQLQITLNVPVHKWIAHNGLPGIFTEAF